MTKYEVMKTLRAEFDDEIYPFYIKCIRPKLNYIVQEKAKRERTTINLGWTEKLSKNRTLFKILQKGNIESDLPMFVCEFRWRNHFCFGCFFSEGSVVVYQAHALCRYAERVLQTNIDISTVFYKYIAKAHIAAYHIVLPTPTHPYSYYHGMANALFLGDYDAVHLDDDFLWCNTCISYNETKYSQMRITKTLHDIQSFVQMTDIDFADPKNESQLNLFIARVKNNEEKLQKLLRFFVQKYLLWQLHFSFNFEFSNHFRAEAEQHIRFMKSFLMKFDINSELLSPYDDNRGIAKKGEIDFRG